MPALPSFISSRVIQARGGGAGSILTSMWDGSGREGVREKKDGGGTPKRSASSGGRGGSTQDQPHSPSVVRRSPVHKSPLASSQDQEKAKEKERERAAALVAILYPAASTVGIRGPLVTPELMRRITESESRAGSEAPEERVGQEAQPTRLAFDPPEREEAPAAVGERDGWLLGNMRRMAFMSSDTGPSR